MRMIEIYKVIFCSQSKKYKIIFRTLENDKEFILYFEAQYAKNIAMASENYKYFIKPICNFLLIY